MAVKRAAAQRATERCMRRIQLRRQPGRPDYFRDVFEWLRKPRRRVRPVQERWLRSLTPEGRAIRLGNCGAGRVQRVRDARRIGANHE